MAKKKQAKQFNYAVGFYWPETEGHVGTYAYGSETFFGTMEQARAFRENLREVLIYFMHEAMRSRNVTLANKFKQAGHPELIPILDA